VADLCSLHLVVISVFEILFSKFVLLWKTVRNFLLDFVDFFIYKIDLFVFISFDLINVFHLLAEILNFRFEWRTTWLKFFECSILWLSLLEKLINLWFNVCESLGLCDTLFQVSNFLDCFSFFSCADSGSLHLVFESLDGLFDIVSILKISVVNSFNNGNFFSFKCIKFFRNFSYFILASTLLLVNFFAFVDFGSKTLTVGHIWSLDFTSFDCFSLFIVQVLFLSS